LIDAKNKVKKMMEDKGKNSSVNNIFANMNLNNNTSIYSPENLFFANSITNINAYNSRSKEFYDLLYHAYTEKLKKLMKENDNWKDIVKDIQNEIIQYIDLKKNILSKVIKNSIVEKDNPFYLPNNLVDKFLELNLNDSIQIINEKMNNFLKGLRYFTMYDVYKIDPLKEFNYEEVKNNAINTKFEFSNIPYYQEIQHIFAKLDFGELEAQTDNLLHLSKNNNIIIENRENNVVDDDLTNLLFKNKIEDLNEDILKNINNFSKLE